MRRNACIYTLVNTHTVLLMGKGNNKPNWAKNPVAHRPWNVGMDVESAVFVPMRPRMIKTTCTACAETDLSTQKQTNSENG